MKIDEAPSTKYIIILDCCFSASKELGALALLKGWPNVAIAFASSAREAASDGPLGGKNGAFTAELLRRLTNPKLSAGVTFERLFKVVKNEVAHTPGVQLKDLSDYIPDFVVLRPCLDFLMLMLKSRDVVDKLPKDVKLEFNEASKAGLPLFDKLKCAGLGHLPL
jgi:hypothetical protein